MTETELKHRMSADVAGVEASPDLLDRAREGGARRVRRRRFIAIGAVALATAAVGGAGLAAPGILDRSSEPPIASTPGDSDPYAFLMNGSTGGDLAGDTTYLRQVLEVWRSSHGRSMNHDRGIFNHLLGDARVAWAGHTPGGRAAIVVENSDLRRHSNVQLYREGVATLIGFVGEGPDGSPKLIGDGYPVPGAAQEAGFVVEKDGTKALVAVQLGTKPVGWSAGRTYADNGSVRREYRQLHFTDSVAVVQLPGDQDLAQLRINRMPGTAFSNLSIVNGGINHNPPETTGGKRLWDTMDYSAWPLTDGANALAKGAHDVFDRAVSAVSDPNAYATAMSMWVGYGVTANGTAVYIGEQQLDDDPTHVYAVLKPKAGKLRIVGGGVPDGGATLPVAIRLPDGQGWAVARKDAQLSFRYAGGVWSPARSNAVLVPAGQQVEVRVQVGGSTEVVPLR